MTRRFHQHHIKGFTLAETVVAIAAVSILTLGMGILLAHSQQNWGRLYGRVYSASATDSFAIQQTFDTVCRKASLSRYAMSESGDSLELYYWDKDSTASTPENYARFYQNANAAVVEYGVLQDGTWQPDITESTTTVTLASQVQSLKFTVEGTSAQMILTYVDTDVLPVVCSSVRHND